MVVLAFTLADCTPAQREVYMAVNEGDFTGNGCRHSQAMIAARIGRTRVHVSRCAKALEAMDLLEIDRPHNRRQGNTYRVRDWTPTLRMRVIAECQAIRTELSRRAQCDKKRTATASRAHTTPQDPSSPRSACGCARGTHPISARRSCMCDCKDCAETIEKVTTELSGAMHTVRKLGAENLRLRGGVPHGDPDDPKTANVWFLLENWLWLCRGRKRNDQLGRLPVIDPGSKRWTLVSRALKREPEGAVACMEAIEGLACKPYVSSKGRSAEGRPSQRYDDIKYALEDETTVERCRRYRAEMLGASEPVLFAAWRACSATDHLYFTLWTGRRARDAFSSLPEYKRTAHRMRVAEAQDAVEMARVIDLRTRRSVA